MAGVFDHVSISGPLRELVAGMGDLGAIVACADQSRVIAARLLALLEPGVVAHIVALHNAANHFDAVVRCFVVLWLAAL